MRRLSAFAVLSLLWLSGAMLPAGADAGDADDPEWTDPTGDVVVTEGGVATGQLSGDDFADVDLLAAWFETVPTHDYPGIRLTLQAAAPVLADTQTTIRLQANATDITEGAPVRPTDRPEITVVLLGDEVTEGPATFGGVITDDLLVIDFDYHSLEAAGGDDILLVAVERERSRTATVPILDADQVATDSFEGAARAFPIPRGPVEAGLTLEVLEGTLVDATGTYPFTALPVSTEDRNARIDLVVRVANTGTDHDTLRVTADAGRGAIVSVPAGAQLVAPGNDTEFPVTVRLRGAIADVELWINATSDRGGEAAFTSGLTVIGPPGQTPSLPPFTPPPQPQAPGRTPVPAGLTWLTGLAEWTGLDEPLGEYAELVLLSILVLLAVTVMVAGWAATRASRSPTVPPEDQDAPDGEVLLEAASMQHVRQQIIPGKPTLVLDSLEHVPDPPEPGDDMTSTVTVANTGAVGARLRAVLEVDGRIMSERLVAAPAHQRVRIRFPWHAGTGRNEAVVRFYAA